MPTQRKTKAPVKPNRDQRRFVPKRKTYVLDFDGDPDLDGLEVRARSVALGTFMELVSLASAIDDSTTDMSSEDVEAIRSLFEGFAGALKSWNVEQPVLDDNGDETDELEPVPATLEGLYTQDMTFVMSIIAAWMDAVAGVSGPLAPSSPGGAPSLEASMPQVTSSRSRAS